MIARTWHGKVPFKHAAAFHLHLRLTGVRDYRKQAGCLTVQLWRKDRDGWAHFVLTSTWDSMESIRRYAGDAPERAVLYPGDEAFELVPDTAVEHYEVLNADLP
jgi:quinol monooxygenase YgiN